MLTEELFYYLYGASSFLLFMFLCTLLLPDSLTNPDARRQESKSVEREFLASLCILLVAAIPLVAGAIEFGWLFLVLPVLTSIILFATGLLMLVPMVRSVNRQRREQEGFVNIPLRSI